MEFIAAYWWLWLVGVLVALAALGVRSICSFVGLLNDAHAIANDVHSVMQAPKDEQRQRFAELGLAVARDKIRSRIIGYLFIGGLALFGGASGLLLVLAMVHHIMAYVRSSA